MKLDTKEFHALFTSEMKDLINIFERYNYELRIAGGAVRDLLMQKQPHDIDFASNATPEQMKAMFTKENIRMFNNKGETHGTISVRINDKQTFEITTLRIDVITDGRHAEVKFTNDWYLDANRRDLTINSMFLELDGTVIDHFNGIEDLEKRRVKFVGSPVARIREDYLRILRYFRFYGRIAQEPNKHDPETLKTIRENANGLSGIAGERLWTELSQILKGNYRFELMKTILDLGIAPHVGLHVNLNMNEFNMLHERAADFSLEPITIIASFLENEADMLKFNERMKLSKNESELGYFIINHREDKPCEDPLQPYQALMVVNKNGKPVSKEWVVQLLSYRGDRKLLTEFESWKLPKFPINGQHLLARGIAPGKMFHYIMAAMKKRWISSSFTLTDDDLLANFDDIVQEVDEQYPNSNPNKGKKKTRKGSKH